MKKGFALIELLAVIVILAVISLITIPMLLNVVEDSRKAAFKATCNEIYEAYNQYRINEEIKGEPNIDVIFDFNSGREETEIIDGIKYEPISKLSLKGELPKFGTYEVIDGKQELIVDNGKYTCVRSENRNEILDGAVADNDLTAPILREIILSSTTNSIKVIVDGYEEDGLITKYYYQINNGEVIERDTSVYVFNNLNTKEEYEIKVYVENKSGLKSEILSKKIETKEISGTTYEEIKTPEGYEYSTSKVLKIKYDEQTGLSYYLKADVEVEVVNGIIEECGSDTLPGVCTSTSVTTLEANKWYRTNISTTNVVFRKNGNLYTTISDGQNTSSMSTYNVSKIDTTAPNVSLSISGEKTDRVTIIAVCSDSESGIIKYEYSDGTNWYDGGLNGSYTITGLSSNKEYEFKVRCTNGANETNEATESNSTLGITNPSVAYEKTPSTPANGYLTSEILKVTYSNENIVSPEYFVKTTRKGVSSISVTQSCGTGDKPGTCTNITSTTTLEANIWYKVSGNINVTYTEASSTTGTLYALTYDGTNYSGAATGEISKIDTTSPNVSLSISGEKTDRVTITAVCSDSETGITKYEYSDGNKWYDGGLNSSYTITGLSSNKEYEFKVRCTNGVNKTKEASTKDSTLGITNPSIAYEKTPSTPVNGYLTSEILKITYSNANIVSPQYFVKTTRKGTSSLSVSESCGNGDKPGTCTNITSTTTLTENTWYKVNGNINVTYTEASSTTGTLYALTYDGTNYSGAATGEISKIDTTAPNVSLSISGEKTDRVTITAVCSDTETGITKYEYSDGNKWYDGGLNSSYTITGLSSNKEYEFKVRCTNGLNKTEEASTKDSTLGITNPSIEYEKTPSSPVNGYLTSETLKVTYSNTNIASPSYFVKTTRKGTSSLSVSESCGNGDKPGTCTNITSTTTLEANTWYKVSGNVNVTYTEASSTVGTLYALTYDGTNYSGAATGEISKIDTTSPNLSLSTSGEKTDRVTITAVCSDSETGITKYEYSDGNKWYDGGLNSSYTITGLSSNKEYEFKVRCTNGVNKTKEASTKDSTLGITNPSIAYEKTPSTPVNGYLTSEILKITYSNANIVSPQYFVKTTRKGTSSLSVSESCGNGDKPGTCTNITSTTTLEANTWYKVSGNVNVTYNEYATEVGTLYALTYDGTNYSGAATGEISKITKEVTYTVKHYQMNTDMTNYTLYETETKTATANYTTTPSVKTYAGFASPSTQNVTVSADGSTVVEYRYARKQIVTTFYRNTSASDTTTHQQTFTYGVSGQKFSAKGWTRSGYTIGGWRTSTSGEYVYTLTSEVSDNWINTNSPSINLYAVWIKNPAIAEASSVITSGYTWATSRTIKITYTNTNMASPKYYFKSSVAATVPSGTVTAACGTSTNPGTCEASSVTTLVANTWYQTTSTTPSITFTKVGTLTAATIDGNSGVYASSTYNVPNVSDGTPTEPTITGGSETWSQTAKTISVSTESTEASGIHHYQYCISGAPNTCAGTWVDLASGVKSAEISTNGTRYIVFRAVANNGKVGPLSGTQTTMIDTGIPTAPTITGGSDSWSNAAKTISVSTDSTSASPISYYQYCISGITSGCNGAWTDILPVGTKSISISDNGTRYIYFRGVNVLGEPSLASNYQTTMIDTSDPTVTVSVSGKTATFTISDNIGTVGYGINQSTTSQPSYTSYVTTNGTRTWTASAAGTYQVWVKDNAGRTARAQFTIASTAFCAYSAGQVWNYAYSGGVQSFAVPCSGTYKLEVWGAQGGSTALTGGYGGYSYGNKSLTNGTTLYIVVGGSGGGIGSGAGGYNGGGYGSGGGDTAWSAGGGGGGATHIATRTGVLSSLASYKSNILIVAGGGGGAGVYRTTAYNEQNATAGTGGGTSGGTGGGQVTGGGGGTQSAGGAGGYDGAAGTFGQGGSYNTYGYGAGGGGGYYGGGSGGNYNGTIGGGGGSGYIGGVTSAASGNGQRSGHGYARITLVSITQ